mmetsp:Transcript_3761/g.5661  ORF Transcript_3761/g.5661 Transcript_3761/m.5661 type:complete len:300 (+) Transcript_3761:370-1269(+)|eukprot:CAMPEP_0175099366 /NCGR_PEP_ID=MMETSP0086_2-20121207/6417_1 /TAXON_ID=136419 /ORGANISM="Unknown Unknown, Strain D1" /LENGTH=299 /DNA_ID=CAMNT_0016373209 /DNA_START=20 /DNA_END=919 /DNA_ORIENTATION=-
MEWNREIFLHWLPFLLSLVVLIVGIILVATGSLKGEDGKDGQDGQDFTSNFSAGQGDEGDEGDEGDGGDDDDLYYYGEDGQDGKDGEPGDQGLQGEPGPAGPPGPGFQPRVFEVDLAFRNASVEDPTSVGDDVFNLENVRFSVWEVDGQKMVHILFQKGTAFLNPNPSGNPYSTMTFRFLTDAEIESAVKAEQDTTKLVSLIIGLEAQKQVRDVLIPPSDSSGFANLRNNLVLTSVPGSKCNYAGSKTVTTLTGGTISLESHLLLTIHKNGYLQLTSSVLGENITNALVLDGCQMTVML